MAAPGTKKQRGPRGKGRKQLGDLGEELVARHLLTMGFEIRARNYRRRGAEIDVIAQKGGRLVFVEVKTRRTRSHGSPVYSVTEAKQRKLAQAALLYLSLERPCFHEASFAVASVEPDGTGAWTIQLLEDAFENPLPW